MKKIEERIGQVEGMKLGIKSTVRPYPGWRWYHKTFLRVQLLVQSWSFGIIAMDQTTPAMTEMRTIR